MLSPYLAETFLIVVPIKRILRVTRLSGVACLWMDVSNFFLRRDFKHQYLKQSPTRIGPKYKKAMYYLYKNESFTERLEDKQRKNERGILGPVIRAQVRDVVTVRSQNLIMLT